MELLDTITVRTLTKMRALAETTARKLADSQQRDYLVDALVIAREQLADTPEARALAASLPRSTG